MKADSDKGKGNWIDMGGLIAPQNEVEKILLHIEENKISDICAIQGLLKELHQSYYEFEWNWASELIEWRMKKSIDQVTIDEAIGLVEQWKKSVVALDQMLYNDARKEFQLSSMIGFGIDGDLQTQQADFEVVRGKFESNSLVGQIKNHIKTKTELGDRMIEELKACR